MSAPPEAAEWPNEGALIYGSDSEPGIFRVRRGRGFRYERPSGVPVSQSDRERIAKLAIPPAWSEVWIAGSAHSHIQATGRDSRGRKQSIYHPAWREQRDQTKFAHLLTFGVALPLLRARVENDLGRSGLSREKTLAAVVRLLDATAIRIGAERYRVENGSVGLTTLRSRHVDVDGPDIRFHFRGKGGAFIAVRLRDRRVAAVVTRLQDLPGQELFCYRNGDGVVQQITSSDVNAYLDVNGERFTAKEFRTWTASVIAAEHLAMEENSNSISSSINSALDAAAAQLKNTRTVCRKCYVHPAVTAGFTDGWLGATWRRGASQSRESLLPPEGGLMAVLRRHTSMQMDASPRQD